VRAGVCRGGGGVRFWGGGQLDYGLCYVLLGNPSPPQWVRALWLCQGTKER
jgi:hypothetical protein